MQIAFPVLSAVVALLAAVPLGPINMEIIRRVLNRHPISALMFAAGAAIADGLWPLAAFMGLAPLLKIHWLAVTFWSVAVMVLLFMGTTFIREARKDHQDPVTLSRDKKRHFAFAAGFLLVISNPANLVTWISVIGIFHNEGLLPASSFFSGFVLWISVVAGTLAYFSVVILVVNRYHKAFIGQRRLRLIKLFFGYIILAMACYFGYNLVRTLMTF